MRPVTLLIAMLLTPLLACAQTAGKTTPAAAATSSSVDPAPIEIVKLEQNLWTTMAESGFGAVRDLFAPDFIEVDQHIRAADALLINLKHCKLVSYDLRDLQVRILASDSALTAYHVVSSFRCGTEEKQDQPVVKNYDDNSVTVWVRKPGTQRWLVEAHTETPAQP